MEGGFNEEVPQANHFEQQFTKKEVIQTTGGPTEVVDIEPQSPKDTVPILLAPGWTETPRTHKESLKEIFDANRRALTVDHPRRGQGIIGDKADYPMAEVRKMQSLVGVMNQKELDTVDVIAHSEGAINTIIAATLYPERFRNIVLVNPGGLIGQDTRHGFVGRLMVMLAQDAIKPHLMNVPRDKQGVPITSFKERVKYFAGNPDKLRQEVADLAHEKVRLVSAAIESARYLANNPRRAMDEMIAMTELDIVEMVKNLHDKGIGISVIQGVDDPLFPMNRMMDVLKNTPGLIDGFYSVRGGHNKLVTDERYIRAALNALDNLRDKPQRVAERMAAENNAKTSPS